MSKEIRVHLALAAAGLIYGANYIIAKAIMPVYMAPFALIVVRVVVAGLLFWIFHALFIKEKLVHVRDYKKFFLVAIFGSGANMLSFFKGLSYTSAINASIIMTMVPIIVLVTSYIILKERITKLKMAGIIIGGFGAILLITSSGASSEKTRFIGDLLVIANSIFYGIYLVIVKPLMLRYHPVTVVKWVFIFGFFMVLPFGFHELTQVQWSNFPFTIWMSLAFVVVGTTCCTYLLNAWALKHTRPSVAGAYVYLQPVFATFITIVFGLGSLDWQQILFSLLIFAGVYLVGKNDGH
ncbi:DMT family transporter [Fulvivirgaceae bacterium BMA12]|uniref:DMT family transporter n=1 Tax=Agaribacillus aureus TaxID=3051825 RepID=A0ABT8LC34_9BACT|nr:DMT family transporter [Fulvivirgaceae bacterium BMA12]